MESLFETNMFNGYIQLNPEYQSQLHALFSQIKDTLIPSGTKNNMTDTIFLNHWAYRRQGFIWHSLEFNNSKLNYTLKLVETKFVKFTDFSSAIPEGGVCIYDSLDVNGFIHHLHQYLGNEGINLIFSFSNSCI